MKNRNLLFLFLSMTLFFSGVILGLFSFTGNLRASSPEGETSAGEGASVFYDEHWRAVGAYAATETGYAFLNPSTGAASPVAGKIELISISTAGGVVTVPHTTLEPDMVITKWKVHGHVHFE